MIIQEEKILDKSRLYNEYTALGISPEVIAFCTDIEKNLAQRFLAIDEVAEFNQL